MSRKQTRRKCLSCPKLFIPDPRNQSRQHYCSAPAWRKASKAASQRRWLSKAGDGDYFRAADQVRRVQPSRILNDSNSASSHCVPTCWRNFTLTEPANPEPRITSAVPPPSEPARGTTSSMTYYYGTSVTTGGP